MAALSCGCRRARQAPIHSHDLRQFVAPGSRVLEGGAGPGRFTQILAELGCLVVVADLSPVQLALHKRHASEHGFESAVESRQLVDICQLGDFETESFDAVIAYGGPLSYVFEASAASGCLDMGTHILLAGKKQ